MKIAELFGRPICAYIYSIHLPLTVRLSCTAYHSGRLVSMTLLWIWRNQGLVVAAITAECPPAVREIDIN